MSLQIIFRPARNLPAEVRAWLADSHNTIEVLQSLASAINSLQALQQDRVVMNLTAQLMAEDFTALADRLRDADQSEVDFTEIKSLLHRTSDMVDGIMNMGVKVNEIGVSIQAVAERSLKALQDKQPKTRM